jgi:hypothetical protein
MLEDGKSTGDVVSLVSDNVVLRDGMRISDPGGPLDGKIARLAEMPAPAGAHYWYGQANTLAEALIPNYLKDGLKAIEADRCPSHVWQPLRAGVCPLCQPTLGGAA